MTTLLLVKQLYLSMFQSLGNDFVGTFLKVLCWFCFLTIGMVLYAFLYRAITGFAF